MTAQEALHEYARTLDGGQHKKECPQCGKTRKKNKHDKCLSISVESDHMLYNCHHCGWNGRHSMEEPKKIPQLQNLDSARMKKINKLKLTDEALAFLRSRCISEGVARDAGLFSLKHYINAEQAMVNCIGFPYVAKGEESGAKIRSIKTKGFSCTNALRSFFNIDNVIAGEVIFIVEGEIDALSLKEVGVDSVVSVPNGAVAKLSTGQVDPREDRGFSFLWDAREILDKAEKIVIATDADSSGKAMAEEIARRLGKERCWQIHWPQDRKDANEVLVQDGRATLVDILENPKPWPVAGVYDANNYRDSVMQMYSEGIVGGLSTGYEQVDELYTTVGGQLTVVTGMPSSGKSEFIDQIMMNQAVNYGHKFAVCSFENEPRLHIAKFLSKYTGKPFFEGNTPRLDENEFSQAFDFVDEHFIFLHHQESDMTTLDDIIDRLKIAVMRHGIRGAVIDPYNYIDRPKDMAETEWISQMLTRLRVFAQSSEIHLWFVAHPTKMPREGGTIPVPKGNDIAGSAAWFAKADFGLTVHRPNPETNVSEIHCWKCRYNWCGRQGQTELIFDRITSRYREQGFQDRYIKPEAEPDELDTPF